jgi:hypothetical protein
MRFNPTNMEPVGARLTPGWHVLRVAQAEETTSQAGNEMIRLHLSPPGGGITLRDYLVASPKALWKVKQFAEAAGLGHLFDQGTLRASDCEGREVEVELIEEQVDGYDRPLLRPSTYRIRTDGGQPDLLPPGVEPIDEIPF